MKLRPYQDDMVGGMRQAYARRLRAVLAVLPTGGGKTFTFVFTAKGAVARGSRVCILVHRRELLKQASRSLDAMDVQHGLIAPGRRQTQDAVQVASVQTLIRRIRKYQDAGLALPPSLQFDLIVIDEAHHATAGSWRQVLDTYPAAKVLGVTATPTRSDGQGLGADGGGIFDEIVIGPQIQELIDDGYLVDARVYSPPEIADTTGLKVGSNGDFRPDDLARLYNAPTVTGDAIAHYRKLAPRQPAVYFCADVKAAKDLAEEFNAAGFRFVALDGGMDDADRDEGLRAMGAGEIDGITSCDIVSEGTDIPRLTVAGLLRKTESLGLYLQQIGRALRPVYAPGFDLSTREGRLAAIAASDKPYAIVLDHCGNVKRHGMPQAFREWSLDAEVESKAGGKSDKVPPVIKCEKCFIDRPGGKVCPVCGHENKVEARTIIVADGELAEVDPEEMREREAIKTRERAACRTIGDFSRFAKKYGYKPGWAFMQMRMRSKPARNLEVINEDNTEAAF
jgi:superfamily II DNA or RNA helicase